MDRPGRPRTNWPVEAVSHGQATRAFISGLAPRTSPPRDALWSTTIVRSRYGRPSNAGRGRGTER